MRVLFVSSGNSKEGISPIVKSQGESLKKESIYIDYYLVKGKGIVGYLKSILILRDYIRGKKYDVIHAHYGSSALVAFFGIKKEKLVVSFMGDDLVGSNDSDGRITKRSKILIYVNKFFAKYFYHFNIVKSNEMLKVIDFYNSKVISNGIDFDCFYEINKDIAKFFLEERIDIKKVLFCSNPSRPEKNYSLAKKAIDILDDRTIELKYIDGIDQKELIYHYNSSDCVLLTSFHEGSPNVIKETMACNIPIVSTNVGDVKEVIGKTKGCYLTTFDPENVAYNIKKVLNLEERTTGRKDVKHLESGLVAKKIIKIYKTILRS